MTFFLGVARPLFHVALAVSVQQQGASDAAPVVRRMAATAALAAQEYRVGVSRGRIVAPTEVEEALLFLHEARRSAEQLPADWNRRSADALDEIIRLVGSTQEPDSVSERVRRLNQWLSQEFGVDLDEVPSAAPTLAAGARVYQDHCAGCHGILGGGDGSDAPGLDPPPASLTDWDALRERSPLDYYRRVTLGVAGTAMPAFETRLSLQERWAVAAYATRFRLPPPGGNEASTFSVFTTSARMNDLEILAALGVHSAAPSQEDLARVATVRDLPADQADPQAVRAVFDLVRARTDSALALALGGEPEAARALAFDAYLAFEGVERTLRARDPSLAGRLETIFATFRGRVGGALPAELEAIRTDLVAGLDQGERELTTALSPFTLFLQSLVILLREGLEAILIIGALIAFLLKTGGQERRRDVHIGVGTALVASVLTAVALETIFQISRAHQEMLEGFTMLAAMGVLFYVSYWLLSKMEAARWNRFVKGKVQQAVAGGSALALPSVAFLAVYREGFETVLFYKALIVSAGAGAQTLMPVLGGIAAGTLALAAVYIAINRYGVRIPLKPFFGITSAFLLYMAFVFAGKGVVELQDSGLIGATMLSWAPRLPTVGLYPTVESLALQALLVLLVLGAVGWTFVLEPRLSLAAAPAPAGRIEERPAPVPADVDLVRSLDRMDADLAAVRAELVRIRDRFVARSSAPPR